MGTSTADSRTTSKPPWSLCYDFEHAWGAWGQLVASNHHSWWDASSLLYTRDYDSACSESRPVHTKSAPSVGKFHLTVFWGCDAIIHMNYCPPKQNINAAHYSSLLQTVYPKLPRIRPGKIHSRPLFLQDNARVHTARLSMAKLRDLKWQWTNETLPMGKLRQSYPKHDCG